MLLKKPLCLIMAPIITASSLYADFFAFRKLVHPQTKKTVYLLYDAHASNQADKGLTRRIMRKVHKIMQDPAKKQYRKEIIGNSERTVLIPWEENEEINKILASFKYNFPHLIQQQKDLLKVLRRHKISLINEDWPPFDFSKRLMTFGSSDLNKHFVNWYMGAPSNDGRFVEYVTPMLGLGKEITGSFSVQKFVPLKTGGYYYNPDKRRFLGIQGDGPEACELIEELTIKAIDDLFAEYNQSAVIISEGYAHAEAIANDLVLNKGYHAEPLIISNDLAIRRKENPKLDAYLKQIESIGRQEKKLIIPCNESDAINYSLIAQPLDLGAIFDTELNTKNATNSAHFPSRARHCVKPK